MADDKSYAHEYFVVMVNNRNPIAVRKTIAEAAAFCAEKVREDIALDGDYRPAYSVVCVKE